MAEILLGLALGLAIAAAGLTGYVLGRKGRACRAGNAAESGTEQQDALMKKYEAILAYDPYGERV